MRGHSRQRRTRDERCHDGLCLTHCLEARAQRNVRKTLAMGFCSGDTSNFKIKQEKNKKRSEKKISLNKMGCCRPALGNELCQGIEMSSLSQPEPEGMLHWLARTMKGCCFFGYFVLFCCSVTFQKINFLKKFLK